MERRNRNAWIAVAVILVVCCGCVVIVAAAALSWFVVRVPRAQTDLEIFDLGARTSARVEETFQVGATPYLEVRNFAGTVSIRSGEDNLIRVVATRRASSTSALGRIAVDMSQQRDRVVVRTKTSSGLANAYVELEITAPPGTEVDLDTGAGTIELSDMTGAIRAHSGAGTIMVRGAAGPVRLGTGAGSIQYQGTPSGHCSFDSGAGEIRLRLPANPDVRVDLSTGLGTVDVGYHVDGSTSRRNVKGVIGDGSQGSIYANTGLGTITVNP
jgi:DUF4097 and DUF4098 domain-containing protein YvlB